jgi:glycosyltransferase involved in cell wall biosynthesis
VKTPLLSVVIPAWNRAQLVCDAVNSALAQRAGEVEVIVVDDASTDATVPRLDAEFGEGIRLLRLDQGRGAGGARNAGARLARGEFVGFLDSDDLWLPGKFDAELEVFARFPEAEVLVSDSQNFFAEEADGSTRFAQNGLLDATQGEVRRADECCWLWTNSMNTAHTCSITVRRAALAKLGKRLFAEDLVCCEDWEFQMRLYYACRVAVLPQVWSHVRRFDDESRAGRAVPGRPATSEQEALLLHSRLTVMDRSQWLTGLDSHLAAELERFREETVARLLVSHGGTKVYTKAQSGA